MKGDYCLITMQEVKAGIIITNGVEIPKKTGQRWQTRELCTWMFLKIYFNSTCDVSEVYNAICRK